MRTAVWGPDGTPGLLSPHIMSDGLHFWCVQAGCEPILHMRDFQKKGVLGDQLVQDINTRHG